MTAHASAERTTSFAEERGPNSVDRFGRWLSTARIRRFLGDSRGLRTADIGCGYDAALSRTLFSAAASQLLVDIHLDPTLAEPGRVTLLEGHLPAVLEKVPDASMDLVVANNVIEHLWEPLETLVALHRITAPGGKVAVNVPSWRGRFFLELAAFRLGVAPADEMNDHKTYYDPRDLWPLVRRSGFLPSDFVCIRHKFGLNTIALCRRA